MKDTIKNLCTLLVIGFIAYKIYEKFFKGNVIPEFTDGMEEIEPDLTAEAEESLAEKIKNAAWKVLS